MAVVNLDMDVTERALAAAHASRTVERAVSYTHLAHGAEFMICSYCFQQTATMAG